MNEEQRILLDAGENLLTSRDQLPTGFGDVVGAMYDSFVREDRSNSRIANEAPRVREALDALHTATGDSKWSAWNTTMPGQFSPRSLSASYPKQRDLLEQNASLIESLKADHPDLQTLEDIRAKIAADAKGVRDELDSVASRASPSARFFGQLVGAAGGALTDPINLATLPIGLPAAYATATTALSRVLYAAGYGAAISGATEVAIQPFVYDYKQDIQSPYTAADAALNVFAAAVGGGILVGGAAAVPPLAKAGGESLVSLYRKAVKRGEIEPTREADAAATVIEEADRITHQNPLQPTPQAAQAHLEAVERAQRQLDAGQAVDVDDIVAPHRIQLEDPTDVQGMQSIDPRTIGVDAERFQFKAGTGADGVSDRLQGVTRWEPELAGLSIVWEDKAGSRWIVDGHQRLGLARRLQDAGGEGADGIRLNAIILREADGITSAEATARAAIKNIAEGTGTAVDGARVIRNLPDDLRTRMPELPPNSALVRNARDLAKLDEEAFRAVINEVVQAEHAAIVGRLISDRDQQFAALNVLAKSNPANLTQAEAMVRDVLSAPMERAEGGDLFGDLPAESLYAERAKVLDAALRRIRRDKSTFKFLVDRERDILGNGENRLDSIANEARASESAMALQSLMADAYTPGKVADALNEAARAVKAGESVDKAAKRVADAMGARNISARSAKNAKAEPKPEIVLEPTVKSDGEVVSGMPDDAELFARVDELLNNNPDAVIPEIVDDGAGGVEVLTRPARKVFEEIDAESKAIDDVITCITGAAVANA